MERVHRFAKINLATDRANYLSILATYSPTDERFAVIENLPTRDSRFAKLPFAMSQISYTPRGGERHYALLVVARPGIPLSKDDIAVNLVYSLNTDFDLRKARPVSTKESDLWGVAVALGVPEDVSATVDFEFAGRGGKDLWFPLPALLAGGRDPEDVFELRSVSGVKKGRPDNGNPSYRFTLSCPYGKDVNLTISIDEEGPITPSIARAVLRQATHMAPDLVPQQPPGGRNVGSLGHG